MAEVPSAKGAEQRMKLEELISGVGHVLLQGSTTEEISGLSRDNRKAEAGDLFICTAGARFDTHDEAVLRELCERGVRAFVVEKDVDLGDYPATVVKVDSTRKAGAHLYAAWYGHPERSMTLIGVTGSKGKTTATHMIASVFRAAGRKVGLIGTNGLNTATEDVELTNTTPDYDELMRYFAKFREEGIDTAVLEVSSQAVLKSRVEALTFDYGVWLNLQEGDHVGPNEHESFEEYMQCKADLLAKSRVRFLNLDDDFVFGTRSRARKKVIARKEAWEALYFGTGDSAAYRLSDISDVYDEETKTPGIEFTVSGRLNGRFYSNFPGEYNAWNALAAIAVANEAGLPKEAIREGLKNVQIKGRNELVYRGEFTVCVDFAHNGESAFHHLTAVRAFRPKRVIAVFGADGNRSKGRRYGMGEAAGRLADLAIVTSGHNRFETYEEILEDTIVGFDRAGRRNFIPIKNRKEAIRFAIDHALPGDFITILGLGHEHWQEENGVKTVYNDGDFVREVLKEKGLIE